MKNIALAMSGGGFRAAAFALGTLDYLNDCVLDGHSLLENVSFIGSTSGGSLTNIFYTLNRHVNQKKDFRSIYIDLVREMEGEKLIRSVFEVLGDKRNWEGREEKGRNLINAFAISYSKIFQDKTFGDLFLKSEAEYQVNNRRIPHIKEISINATEFSNGLSFRFQSQAEGKSRGKIGNNYINLTNTKTAGKLLLGDLMACSSCFSGGFEPIIFPDDFVHKELSSSELLKGLYYKENPFTISSAGDDLLDDETFREIKYRFGIMDGGIADNQAIESVIRANARNHEDSKFDLIILTDVTSYFLDGYTLPMRGRAWYGFLKINYLKWVMRILILAAVVCGGCMLDDLGKPYMVYISLIGLLCALIYGFVAYKISQMARKGKAQKSTWLLMLMKYGGFFNGLRIDILKQMVQSRLKSVFLLANDIYLKQIRKLYYEKIYKDSALNPIVVSNAIYDLSKVKVKAGKDDAINKEVHFSDTLTDNADEGTFMSPSQEMREVAEKARLMPTTLWFDEFQVKEKRLDAILETGKFTICYNLLKYYNKRDNLNTEEKKLKIRLEVDWQAFKVKKYNNILE